VRSFLNCRASGFVQSSYGRQLTICQSSARLKHGADGLSLENKRRFNGSAFRIFKNRDVSGIRPAKNHSE
jgi:hypothetical protein